MFQGDADTTHCVYRERFVTDQASHTLCVQQKRSCDVAETAGCELRTRVVAMLGCFELLWSSSLYKYRYGFDLAKYEPEDDDPMR